MLKLGLIIFFISISTYAEEVSFSVGQLTIGGKSLSVEIAKTPKQHARGLMFRKSLKKDSGMLFVFVNEQIRSFWMKNTFIDLDIGYFNKEKVLIDIKAMKAVASEMETKLPRYLSRKPAQFALEVNRGWFKRNNIKLGAQFSLVQGKSN